MKEGERPAVAMALVHYPVVDRTGERRATSVTPLNIHDLARSATTYGVEPFYIVTPILSQQELSRRILRHWREGYGGVQNPIRRESLQAVSLVSSVNEAVDDLFSRSGAYPKIVGTGARRTGDTVDYPTLSRRIAQRTVPWLILFGTGWGLSPEAVRGCDLFLEPITGAGEFNHLSVRSAAAIILDRLFGK